MKMVEEDSEVARCRVRGAEWGVLGAGVSEWPGWAASAGWAGPHGLMPDACQPSTEHERLGTMRQWTVWAERRGGRGMRRAAPEEPRSLAQDADARPGAGRMQPAAQAKQLRYQAGPGQVRSTGRNAGSEDAGWTQARRRRRQHDS